MAVDAGTHLAGIVRILEQYMPLSSDKAPQAGKTTILKEGPFAGLQLPNISARANAAYIFREIVHAFFITHGHLDHVSGLAINTPCLEAGEKPKPVAALPSTIDAIKNHIFNDIIWPNLSDEDGGAGLVTYSRLIEGGNPRFGTGESRGYVMACEGLGTKCWSISHGRCRKRYHAASGTHHRTESAGFDNAISYSRRMSHDNRYVYSSTPTETTYRRNSQPYNSQIPQTPGATTAVEKVDPNWAAVDSSAFFIRDDATGTEIIVFGDIEPDSLSLNPRNTTVWDDAAPKIASGRLKAIFIECSFDDSIEDHSLYGHLCPRHLIAELGYLAHKVQSLLKPKMEMQNPPSPSALKRKRKRGALRSKTNGSGTPKRGRRSRSSSAGHTSPPESGLMTKPSRIYRANDEDEEQVEEVFDDEEPAVPLHRAHNGTSKSTSRSPGPDNGNNLPLAGLSVYIIHVKDTLKDGPPPGHAILAQLEEQGEKAGLGCSFSVTKCGEEISI